MSRREPTLPPGKKPGRGGVFLSVVIPAFNEEERIGPTISRVRAYLSRRGFPAEVIVVDDGSTDRTLDAARRSLSGFPAGRVLSRVDNRGKGYSVRQGVLASRGLWVLFTDSDLSAPIEELDKFLPLLAEGPELLIGSRALPGSDIQVRQPLLRELMGKAFNLLVRLFVMRGIKDTQCGFKLIRREAGLEIFRRARVDGFGFDVEVLFLGRRLGYGLRQVPVVWRNSARSKVRIVSSSLGMIRDLWTIRRRHRAGWVGRP